MDAARPRGKLGPFIVGVLVGLICGVLLGWLGIVPSPLASGPAPNKGAPPVAAWGNTTPAETSTEGSAKSANPQAELVCLNRKFVAAEGQGAVQQLALGEKLKGAPDPRSDPDYFIQLLRERGYSCDDAEIERSAKKLEQKGVTQ